MKCRMNMMISLKGQNLHYLLLVSHNYICFNYRFKWSICVIQKVVKETIWPFPLKSRVASYQHQLDFKRLIQLFLFFRWYKFMKSNGNRKLVKLNDRVSQVGGTLIIKEAKVDDSGKYLCMVNNSVGGESVETVLTVTGKKQVIIAWTLDM